MESTNPDICSRVAERERSRLISKLERYNLIADYYAVNPKRIGPNREYLHEIENTIFNFTPISLFLKFGKEISEELSALVSVNKENLTGLLLQN